MSNNRERLAREWATSTLPRGDAKTLAAIEHILATTTEPTMDEVEWNEEKHALTGAVVDVGGGPVQVVMLAGSVDGIDYATLDGKFGYEPRYYFTPNGKKYELREVTDKPEEGEPTVSSNENVGADQPEHPETLIAVEDYRSAPVGTIAADPNGYPWVKANTSIWESGRLEFSPQTMFMHGPHTVLRKGWGE